MPSALKPYVKQVIKSSECLQKEETRKKSANAIKAAKTKSFNMTKAADTVIDKALL